MDERKRTLLALRTIDVTYRAALHHAPLDGAEAQEWLGRVRQRADQMLNSLQSRLMQRGPVSPEIALQIRIVRENIARSDLGARGTIERGEQPQDRAG